MTHHPDNDRFDEYGFDSEAVSQSAFGMSLDEVEVEVEEIRVGLQRSESTEEHGTPGNGNCEAAEEGQEACEDRFGEYGFSLGAIKKTALGLLRDPGRADDIAQDVAIRLLRIGDGRDIPNPDEYAKAVTRNMIRDAWRKKKAKYGHERNEVKMSDFTAIPAAVQAASEEKEWQSAKAQWREDIRLFTQAALAAFADQLKARDKDILELISKGQNPTEIARSLGIDRGTVYYRLKRIKKLFENFDPPDPPSPPRGGGGSRASPPVRGDPFNSGIPLSLKRKVVSQENNQLIKEEKQENVKCNLPEKYVLACRREPFAERKRGAPVSWAKRQETGSYFRTDTSPTSSSITAAERFKELFLQLPALREGEQDGPESLEEIEEILFSEYYPRSP